MDEPRVALFVEGSESPPPARGDRPLTRIWNEHLADVAGIRAFDRIVPISKTHLVAMDPRNPPMSGAAEALDQLMARTMRRQPFDAAVVAWDLVPAWNPEGEFCRWLETLDLQLLGLCMEPMFERLLVDDEGAVLQALGLDQRPKGWPGRGWGDAAERKPDVNVLAPAIRAARRQRPRPKITRRIPGDLRTNKDGWGEYLLRRLAEEGHSRARLQRSPFVRRLAEVGVRT